MAIHMPRIGYSKQILRKSSLKSYSTAETAIVVPKGCLAVYVGKEEKTRFVIPVSFLNQASFQDLLSQAEEEFGFDQPTGGLTIPCREDVFINLTTRLGRL